MELVDFGGLLFLLGRFSCELLDKLSAVVCVSCSEEKKYTTRSSDQDSA